jgi:hypothetical protein
MIPHANTGAQVIWEAVIRDTHEKKGPPLREALSLLRIRIRQTAIWAVRRDRS